MTPFTAPLSPDERDELRRVLRVYPPGPLSNAARHLASRIGINHQTLRHAIKGRPVTERTADKIRRHLPTLAGEYRDQIAEEYALDQAYDECSPQQKAARLAMGLSEEQAERLITIAMAVFPSKFEGVGT